MVTVTAWDIGNNTLITHLNVQSYSWSIRLNDAGEFTLKMDLADGSVSQQAAVILGRAGNPFKVIFASDAYNILYSGIAWKTALDSGSEQLTIAGKAITSYFNQVCLTRSYSSTEYPSGISPVTLLQNVVNDIQAQTLNGVQVANMNITPVPNVQSSPPPVVPGYKVNQYVTAAQVLADMTAATIVGTGGVDYYMADVFQGGRPYHQFMIAAPRAGRAGPTHETPVINMALALQWTWTSDAQQSGNQVICIGNGSGVTQNKAIANTTYPLGRIGEMPLLQAVLQYSQVSSKTQLQAIAQGNLHLYQDPVTVPIITLDVNDPVLPLGSYQIGDDVMVQAPPSIWFPQGLNQLWRVAAFTVTYPSEGIATQAITLNRPPIF